jgi:hypothetical protein
MPKARSISTINSPLSLVLTVIIARSYMRRSRTLTSTTTVCATIPITTTKPGETCSSLHPSMLCRIAYLNYKNEDYLLISQLRDSHLLGFVFGSIEVADLVRLGTAWHKNLAIAAWNQTGPYWPRRTKTVDKYLAFCSILQRQQGWPAVVHAGTACLPIHVNCYTQ